MYVNNHPKVDSLKKNNLNEGLYALNKTQKITISSKMLRFLLRYIKLLSVGILLQEILLGDYLYNKK